MPIIIVAETELELFLFLSKNNCIKNSQVSPIILTHFDYFDIVTLHAFVTESNVQNLVHSASILRTSTWSASGHLSHPFRDLEENLSNP